MSVSLVCMSHSPFLDFPGAAPSREAELRAAIAERADAIRAWDPELVVAFGTDHYTGWHPDAMPPFCVARRARAIADVGGPGGALPVPSDVALDLVQSVREGGVDVACSDAMEVDHGFTQTLLEILGRIDRQPVLPIFVDAIVPPFVPFARARALGEAVGRFVAGLGHRVLLLGSGGLSHDASAFFPRVEDSESEWHGYQLHGLRQRAVRREDWLAHVERAHRGMASELRSDRLKPEEISIHPDWDRDFLTHLCAEELEAFDGWSPARIASEIGIGTLEVLTWVAACAAQRTAGGAAPVVDFYAPVVEYGVGFGLLHAPPE